jgi:hypothetical protein
MKIVNTFFGQASVVVNVIKEKIMNSYNVPDWYLTVDEFAHLIADTVYECGYFKRGDRMHPEDIEAAFTSTATAVSKGISFAGVKSGRKISDTPLTKQNITTTDIKNTYAQNTI